MAHEIETMAYVGETPWHGLGKRLTVKPKTMAEAIRLGGVDWQIAKEPLMLADGTVIPDALAVVRQSDRAYLGTVGTLWEPIQNDVAFSPFEPFVASGAATIETVGSLRGGRRVWMLAKLSTPDSVIVPKSDDRVAKYLLVCVGHDGKLSFHLGMTGTRVVCQNTLSIALRAGESTHVRIPHLPGAANVVGALKDTVAAIDGKFEAAAEVFRALAGKRIRSVKILREYIDAVFPAVKAKAARQLVQPGAETLADLLAKPVTPKESAFSADVGDMTKETTRLIYGVIENLFEKGRGNDLPGVKGTAWAAYNAVTEYTTWERGNSQDARLEKVWLESGSGSQGAALPLAIDTFLKN